jgi:hypothetical protein
MALLIVGRPLGETKRPKDIVMGADACWHVLYGDGSLGPALSVDQMLDALPLLQEDCQLKKEKQK